jgi:peptidyl-prolyl cis-trans isomerase SurA
MKRIRTVLIALVAALQAAPALAQEQRTERIGHIVAIVGDSVILNFDLQSGVLAYEAQTRQQITDPAARRQLEQEILRERIDGLLLLQAALRDTTIKVPDEQVMRAVQQQVEKQQQAAGGIIQFEAALRAAGLTMQDYRDRLTAQMRSSEYIRQISDKVRRDRKAPPATEADLRAMFEQRRAQFGQRPATIMFNQIVVITEPSTAALARARARADSVFAKIVAGEDFAELAKRYSEDPSRESGGDLGWSRRTDWVRDFANVAFAMGAGSVSPPILTRFGYHIIKVERARGAEMHLRHILFRPELTQDDALRARARADTVAERLRAGGDAEQLRQQYGDRDELVRAGPAPVDTVSTQLGVDLTQTQPGQVLGPVPQGTGDIAARFIVIKVLEREPAREWTLNDPLLRERLRQDVELQKLMEEVIEELRRSTYVEIREGSLPGR